MSTVWLISFESFASLQVDRQEGSGNHAMPGVGVGEASLELEPRCHVSQLDAGQGWGESSFALGLGGT